jgi:hypothetical protein
MYEEQHVVQDMLVPFDTLDESLTTFHKTCEIYPLWLCPYKAIDQVSCCCECVSIVCRLDLTWHVMAYIQAYIHTFIRTYVHTYIYIYIHTMWAAACISNILFYPFNQLMTSVVCKVQILFCVQSRGGLMFVGLVRCSPVGLCVVRVRLRS